METLYFDKIKERHNSFIIEYSPPITNYPYAILSITSVNAIEINEIIDTLESLTEKWLVRYRVPLLAFAFDQFGDLIDLTTKRESNYLTGIPRDGLNEYHWNILNNHDFDSKFLDAEYLKSIYTDINYRTQEEINIAASKNIKPMRQLKIILLIWAIFIPALISILEFFSPTWVAVIALSYSLWKAYQQWLGMTNRKKKSKEYLEAQKEETLMRHHHYHCQRNPDAFSRLRSENFKSDAKNDIHDEFNLLSD
jgi:hypothetical protein